MSFQQASAGIGAGGLLAATSQFRSEHAGLISKGEGEYQRIPETIGQFEAARVAADQRDAAKSRSFWSELGEFSKHGFNYWADKARFEEDIEELVEGAKQALEELRSEVAKATVHLDVPDRLRAEGRQWERVHRALLEPEERLPGFQQIEGWTGQAAEVYRTMAKIQDQAVKEYVPMAFAMRKTLAAAQEYNEAVLTAVQGSLAKALEQARKDVPGGPKEYYTNTANFITAVSQAKLEIRRALSMAKAPSEALAGEVQRQAASPAVIAAGWPTGTSLADTAARQGAGVEGRDLDDSVDLEVCLLPVQAAER
ncbi:hypothetical protein [uncultured Tessaracoccus sp.]|uniref:hypothetical protein n=1 Tax=uncultured Tessaracoccus sp. TaxID=905023 RepID=UPI00261A62AE|nr:hypothetical protein [uncultured Tessaracoccus sp.]